MRLRNWSLGVLAEDWRNAGFGLYIHWPFCAAKCPYCDFNSHVAQEIDQDRWKRAYLSEIDRHARSLNGRVLNSIFFGGGTPSLMHPDVVAAILERVRKAWPVANDLEVTLEANPGSVDAGRFAAYAAAGVSRLSLGVQALNDRDLGRLGRIHSVADAMQAFDIARYYFNRVSFDLIYARQDQSPAAWRSELRQALAMAIDHISLYQLAIEPGTAFGDRLSKGGLKGLPNEARSGDMYEITQELCEAAGFISYEVSNHAKPGAESRHNLIYWRYGDYAGIGPGAHGRLTFGGVRHATETWRQPDRWLDKSLKGSGDRHVYPLSGQDQADEFVMMGLRVTEGIDRRRYVAMAGRDLCSDTLDHLEDIGMILQENSRIRATENGRLVLNSVIKALLSE